MHWLNGRARIDRPDLKGTILTLYLGKAAWHTVVQPHPNGMPCTRPYIRAVRRIEGTELFDITFVNSQSLSNTQVRYFNPLTSLTQRKPQSSEKIKILSPCMPDPDWYQCPDPFLKRKSFSAELLGDVVDQFSWIMSSRILKDGTPTHSQCWQTRSGKSAWEPWRPSGWWHPLYSIYPS